MPLFEASKYAPTGDEANIIRQSWFTCSPKRLIVARWRPEEGARLNEPLIKQLTGSDPITARGMRQDNWTFDPTHKLWLCTNHKPVIKGTDHAIWRRPKLVPFGVKILDNTRRSWTSLTRLKAEYPGILATMRPRVSRLAAERAPSPESRGRRDRQLQSRARSPG